MWKAFLRTILKNEDIDEINNVINNVILDKISYIEVDLKKNKDDKDELNENIKGIKEIIRINRELNDNKFEEIVEDLDDDMIKLKELLLNTNKNFIRYSNQQIEINRQKDKQILNLEGELMHLRIDNQHIHRKLDALVKYLDPIEKKIQPPKKFLKK